MKGKLNTPINEPDIKGAFGSKLATCSSVAADEPGIKGAFGSKLATGSSVGVHEPGIIDVLGKKVEILESKLDIWGDVAEPDTSRAFINVLDTSTLDDEPDNNVTLEGKQHIYRVIERKLDMKFLAKMSVLDQGTSGGLTTISDISSTLHEPGTSHKRYNTNTKKNSKREIISSQVNINNELESQTRKQKRAIKDHN